jgi:hypothetical protein
MFKKSAQSDRQFPRAPLSLAAIGCLISLLMSPAVARAKPRVAILPFVGPGGEDIENPIIETLPRGYLMVPLEQVDKAVRPFGKRVPTSAPFYVAMARRLAALAVIEGRTSADGGWRLRMTVRRGGNGSIAGALDFRAATRKELEAKVRSQAPNWMQGLLDKAAGYPTPPPPGGPVRVPDASRVAEPARLPATPRMKEIALAEASAGRAEVRDESTSTEERTADRVGRGSAATRREGRDEGRRGNGDDAAAEAEAAGDRGDDDGRGLPADAPLRWEFSVGPRVISRAFVFTDNLAGLPGYTLPATTGVSGEATFFPAAHSRSAARHFGFSGEWASSVGAKTVGRDGARSYPTRSLSYRVGPRYQWRQSNFALNLGADYGNHQFQLDVSDAVVPPNVDYTFLRPNVSTQLDVAAGISLRLEVAYLNILSVGGLGDEDRFPRISSVGAEVGAMVGYALDSDFEIRLSASLRHYAHNMHAKAGDRYMVGGAVDEHFGGSLLLTYRIR